MSALDSYLDVVVRPDEETRASVLLSGLFEQVHRELATRRLTSVGVSFTTRTCAPLPSPPWLESAHFTVQLLLTANTGSAHLVKEGDQD